MLMRTLNISKLYQKEPKETKMESLESGSWESVQMVNTLQLEIGAETYGEKHLDSNQSFLGYII